MAQNSKGLLVIAAGGTIAAEHYDNTPENVHVRNNDRVKTAIWGMTAPHIYDQRQKLSKYASERLGEVFNMSMQFIDFGIKDSKDITEEELQNMAQMIAEAPEELVLITHGTDAMVHNANRITQILSQDYPGTLESKHIVITGAMKPLAHNITFEGSPLSTARYKTMSGWVSAAEGQEHVTKNKTDGFKSLQDALGILDKLPEKGLKMVMSGYIFDPKYTEKKFFELPDGIKSFEGEFIQNGGEGSRKVADVLGVASDGREEGHIHTK